ncbi:MAG TPA: lysylphosphatidylglycerol synthase domain-containing protein [Gaiellaceae bacterium]|nr:lysylphosphatidylglycerol synthase domain-containing protein [Gaiellaceae bacterium]
MTRRRLLLAACSATIAIATAGVVIPQIASYGSIWRAVAGLRLGWIAVLLAVAAANVVTFALPWMVALSGLSFLNALQLTQASTAFTLVVPGGAPLGMGASFAMLRSWGFPRAAVARAVALTGVWNQLSTFLFPVVAALALAAEGSGGGTVNLIALGAALVFLVACVLIGLAFYRRDVLSFLVSAVQALLGLLARARRRVRRRWTREDVESFRSETLGNLRADWPTLTVATLSNQLTAYALLDLSVRAVGIDLREVNVAETFAAWSLARLLASLPLTPGGLGFVELGLTGMLVGFGGPNAKVVAAVLVYRVLSIVPTTLLGLVAFATWNRFRPDGGDGRGSHVVEPRA